MKSFVATLATAATAAAAISAVCAADASPELSISSISSPELPSKMNQMNQLANPSGMTITSASAPQTADVNVAIGTSGVLNRGAGLVNKNTLATDNNIFLTNSNLLLRQNDNISVTARKVESLVLSEAASDMDAATLSSNIMRIVSTPGGSDVTMTKASGVVTSKAQDVAVAAKSGSSMGDLRQRIMDLVSTAMNMSA